MKNINVSLIRFLILLLFLGGCSSRQVFDVIDVNSPEAAFRELKSISDNLSFFSTKSEFQLSGTLGKFRLKGEIQFSDEDGWYVILRGPLGVTVAELETVGDRFIVARYRKNIYTKRNS